MIWWDHNAGAKKLAVMDVPREFMTAFFAMDRTACRFRLEYDNGVTTLDPSKFKVLSVEHIKEKDVFRFLVESEDLPYDVKPGQSLPRVNIVVTTCRDFGVRMSDLHKEYEKAMEEDKMLAMRDLIEEAKG